MDIETLQYDSTIGGNIILPEHDNVFRLAAGRVNEIASLVNAIRNPNQTKLLFQTLPKHMRRRTATQNPKRLPIRFRKGHIYQMQKSGIPIKTKRPARKYRRKPSNLLKEYFRRQRNNVWLETHIWHAKRFHMINKWGYKLPYSPCDKSYRACYRATSKHCLIQDISYFGCIEVSGSLAVLKSGFDRICSSKCGLTIMAKTFISGQREGNVKFFKIDKYPMNAIGDVSFIWKPNCLGENDVRTVWIFVHAAYYQEVLEELINLFETEYSLDTASEEDNKMNVDDEDGADKAKECLTITNCRKKNFQRICLHKSQTTNVMIVELKDTINRFRLTGPLSHAVLSKAFKCKLVESKTADWLSTFLSENQNKEVHKFQSEYWDSIKNITSPAELPNRMILALNIEDPRLNRPKRRTKATSQILDTILNVATLQLPEKGNQSPIWDREMRNSLLNNMMPIHKLYQLRNQNCLVPGERCSFEDDLQPIPVLLIQRPGSENPNFKRLGYGAGWDVVIPAGYGIPTWLCLIMWGARAGGLREMKSTLREAGIDEFSPDTMAGMKEDEIKWKELTAKYFRKPINKRHNYVKLAIASPFKCKWSHLVNEWSGNKSEEMFFVVRDRLILEKLQMTLKYKHNYDAMEIPKNALIPIYIKMLTRGNPGNYSIVCLPEKCDLKRCKKQKRYHKNNPIFTEPIADDPNEKLRKITRRQHLKKLKMLRNRRVRHKRKLQEYAMKKVKIMPPNTTELIAKQFETMCNLWLPETIKTVRHQCSRQVIGYITQSDFSFTEATFAGIGYVTINGFQELLSRCKSNGKILVLIRGTTTRHYRFGSIQICST